MRSLGVIFLADVVGYSKMMAQDEPGTLDKLRNFTKEVIRPNNFFSKITKLVQCSWLVLSHHLGIANYVSQKNYP